MHNPKLKAYFQGNKNYFMRTVYTLLVLGMMLFTLENCGVKKNSQTQDLQTGCCQECLEAFSQSPVGVGANAARCGFFSSSVELSTPCQKYFKKNEVMASACQ